MKTLLLNCLLCSAAFCLITSCETGLLDERRNTDQVELDDLLTRAAISEYDPLENLDGVHINVILNSNGSKKYLSTSKSKNVVDLYDKDDNSGRQKWYFAKEYNTRVLRIVGGALNSDGVLSSNAPLGGAITPICSIFILPRVFMNKAPNTLQGYNIVYGFNSWGDKYLSSKKHGDAALEFQDKSKTGGRDVWEFVPIDNYELLSVRYFQTYSDKINYRPELIDNIYLVNKSNPNELRYTKTISESVTESSSFSEMEGLKMTNKITKSANVGLPVIKLGGELSMEVSNEKTWTYTTTGATTKTSTVTDFFETKVPAYSDMLIKVYIAKSDLNISYEATLKNTKTGSLLTLYGKWEGAVSGREIYVEPIVSGLKSNSEVIKIEGVKHISEFPRK